MGFAHRLSLWWHSLFGQPATAAGPVRSGASVPARPAERTASVSPNDVFTPTRPRAGRRTLVGRQVELARILDAILDDQAHVVLYSERGRGKTSLSNLAIEQLRRRGAIVGRCACEAETNYDTMMRALARDLPAAMLAARPDDPNAEGCESILPSRAIRPADVAAIPANLSCDLTVFVVDEFDRVTDPETRTRLADTIKLLSDRGLRLYFLVVGVSDTLEQIIGQHPSIQRNIVGVHLPLLRDDEIAGMLSKGGQQAGIGFTPEASRVVEGVARGMPYMAQLLGLRIAQAALRRGDAEDDTVQVEDGDVLTAVQRLLDEASSAVTLAHAQLTGTGAPASTAAGVLLRLARAGLDQWGRMTVVHAGDQVVVGGCRLLTTQWERLMAARVVVQPEGENGPAQFSDRALIYNVLLRAAKQELTTRMAGETPDPLDPLEMQRFRQQA